MCLNVNQKLTENRLKGRKVHSNGMVKVWKVLAYKGYHTQLCSPYIRRNVWKPGWNKSDRMSETMTFLEKNDREIYEGIHVCLTRNSAREFSCSCCGSVVVPVYVYEKDFVAAGSKALTYYKIGDTVIKEAVFTKVFFKKADYDKALGIRT